MPKPSAYLPRLYGAGVHHSNLERSRYQNPDSRMNSAPTKAASELLLPVSHAKRTQSSSRRVTLPLGTVLLEHFGRTALAKPLLGVVPEPPGD